MIGLQENAFVHLNKPYYYTRERIWFKVYMLYADYDYRDSLSRVLHVELLNADARSLRHDRLLIANGTAFGDLYLSDSLTAGNYFLKVYTHWMLNYGDSTVTYTPIRILDRNSRPLVSAPREPTCESIRVQHTRDSTRYQIQLVVVNETLREYSVSVTDTALVRPLTPTPFKLQMLKKVQNTLTITHPIERGLQLDLKLKGRPRAVGGRQILAMRQSDKTFETITTDDRGHFVWPIYPGQPTETVLFSMADQPNQPIAFIHNQPPDPTSQIPTIPELELRRSLGTVADFDTLESDAIRLSGVQVKARRSIPNAPVKLYGRPDATISGDVLVQSQVSNPILALQGRVPGVEFLTVSGRIILNIRNSQKSSFSTQPVDPLVLLDGVPMAINKLNDLESIPLFTIDHIDVIRGARAIYGLRGGSGIIAIYTKAGVPQSSSVGQTTTQQFAVPVICKGYAPQHTFAVTKNQSNRPQGALYWNPGTSPNTPEPLKFWVDNAPVTYRIEVVGVRTDGSILKCVRYLTIH